MQSPLSPRTATLETDMPRAPNRRGMCEKISTRWGSRGEVGALDTLWDPSTRKWGRRQTLKQHAFSLS